VRGDDQHRQPQVVVDRAVQGADDGPGAAVREAVVVRVREFDDPGGEVEVRRVDGDGQPVGVGDAGDAGQVGGGQDQPPPNRVDVPGSRWRRRA
jgi:hypothetical protein